MKRSLTRVVTLVIVAVFALSSVSVCAADLKTGANATATKAPAAVAQESDDSVDFAKDTAHKKIKVSNKISTKASNDFYAETITAKTLLKSSYVKPDYSAWYIPADGVVIVPVKTNYNGILYMDAVTDDGNTHAVDFFLCDSIEDALAQNAEGYVYAYDSQRLAANSEAIGDGYGGMPVTPGKTYYIAIYNDNGATTDAIAGVRTYVYTTMQRTLDQGTDKWTLASGFNKAGDVNTTWFKVTPKTTGVMIVSLKEYGRTPSNGYVTLYNSTKGTALSDKLWYSSSSSSSKLYFGVKKGTTYYLKVTSCYGSSSNCYKYGIKYGVTARTDRALGSKSSAKRLYRTKAATNTLFVAKNSNSYDWYKFYVPSKKATRVTVDATGIKSGYLSVKFYKGSDYFDTVKVYAGNSAKIDLTYSTTWGKANKGTYYAKVVKSNKASGKYSIRHTY